MHDNVCLTVTSFWMWQNIFYIIYNFKWCIWQILLNLSSWYKKLIKLVFSNRQIKFGFYIPSNQDQIWSWFKTNSTRTENTTKHRELISTNLKKNDFWAFWGSKTWFTLWKWHQMWSNRVNSESPIPYFYLDTKVEGFQLKILMLDCFKHCFPTSCFLLFIQKTKTVHLQLNSSMYLLSKDILKWELREF